MNTIELAKEYSAAGRGLIFRLRSRSPNQALGYRLQHGPPAPRAEPPVLVRPPAPSRNGHH